MENFNLGTKSKRYTREFSGEFSHTKQNLVKDYSKHKLYMTWRMMNVRCYDDRHASFHRYGGRGITVCPQWRWDNSEGFYNFLEDVGERPESTTLDKINNDGNYSRCNVRWSDKKTQQNNIGVGSRNTTGELGVSTRGDSLYVNVSLSGVIMCVGVFNRDELPLAIERNRKVREIKDKDGDSAARDYYLNLRDLTPSGRVKSRNKTSNFYGVSKRKSGKWKSYTNEYLNGKIKQVCLGNYTCEVEAYLAVIERMKNTGAISEEDYELEKGNCMRYRN